jgi:hypothetical protein
MTRKIAFFIGYLLASALVVFPAEAYLDMADPSFYYETHEHFPFATATVGGGGGAALFDQCKVFQGQFDYLRGFEIHSGNWLDNIIIECGKAQEAQGQLQLGQPYASSMQWGGDGGGLGGDLCERNEGVGGLRLQRSPNNFVGYIALLCRPLDDLSALRRTDRAYGRISDKSPPAQDIACPPGMIAVGISGGYGVYVDRLGLVCLPPPKVLHETILSGMDDNTNRAYSDYRNFSVSVPHVEQCQETCTADSNCRAWAYVRPDAPGKSATCYLKNAIPAAFHDDCCISGVPPRRNPATQVRECVVAPCPQATRPFEQQSNIFTKKMTYKPGPIVSEPGGFVGPAPPMTGTFASDFGTLTLTKVDGTYTYKDGRVTITKIYGDFMDGTWSQTQSSQQCSDGTYHGTFRFRFTKSGFTGTYGYCEDPPGAGPWNGTRQ